MIIKYFNWYGGKQRIVHKILSLIPYNCTEWYEACMGSAVITLNKWRHNREVINDRDPELYNLFSLMAHKEKGQILLERLLKLEYSQVLFEQAKEYKKNEFNGLDPLDKAEQSFILITQSFNSTRKNFRKKGYNQQDYTHSLKVNLPEVFKRLQGMTVTNKDVKEIMNEAKNNRNAFVLLDPPYRFKLRGKGATSTYDYEMNDKQHIKMLETIKDAKCKIMLFGYRDEKDNDLYDEYLLSKDWKRYKIAELVKSCQNKTKKDIGIEYIWVNYELPKISKYIIDLSCENEFYDGSEAN